MPPQGVGAWRVYRQDEGMLSRAGVSSGTPGRLILGLSEVAWSDALQHTARNIASALRLEIALNTALD